MEHPVDAARVARFVAPGRGGHLEVAGRAGRLQERRKSSSRLEHRPAREDKRVTRSQVASGSRQASGRTCTPAAGQLVQVSGGP
jgi:hypothetical protein